MKFYYPTPFRSFIILFPIYSFFFILFNWSLLLFLVETCINSTLYMCINTFWELTELRMTHYCVLLWILYGEDLSQNNCYCNFFFFSVLNSFIFRPSNGLHEGKFPFFIMFTIIDQLVFFQLVFHKK